MFPTPPCDHAFRVLNPDESMPRIRYQAVNLKQEVKDLSEALKQLDAGNSKFVKQNFKREYANWKNELSANWENELSTRIKNPTEFQYDRMQTAFENMRKRYEGVDHVAQSMRQSGSPLPPAGEVIHVSTHSCTECSLDFLLLHISSCMCSCITARIETRFDPAAVFQA